MTEEIMVMFIRYRDVDGQPTCACNFVTGEVCQFLRLERFGTRETCVFAPQVGKYSACMARRGTVSLPAAVLDNMPNLGTLIPGNWCILFTPEEIGG